MAASRTIDSSRNAALMGTDGEHRVGASSGAGAGAGAGASSASDLDSATKALYGVGQKLVCRWLDGSARTSPCLLHLIRVADISLETR